MIVGWNYGVLVGVLVIRAPLFRVYDRAPDFRDTPISRPTVDCKRLDYGCRRMYAGFPSDFRSGLEDGHVPTFWLLLQEFDVMLVGNPVHM